MDPLSYSFPNWNKRRFLRTAQIFGERRSARPSKKTRDFPSAKLVQSEDFRERPEFWRAAQREGVLTQAAGWRGGGAAGWRVRGVRGHGPPLPLEYKAVPQSYILRTGNKDFSLWKSSRFYRPRGTFSLSSGLCIFGTAALRTNLCSANGVSGEAWANVCKLLNELGRVVVWRFHENSSVGHVRACASIYSGLSELARVLPSPFI